MGGSHFDFRGCVGDLVHIQIFFLTLSCTGKSFLRKCVCMRFFAACNMLFLVSLNVCECFFFRQCSCA